MESVSEGALDRVVEKWSGHIDRAIGLRRHCEACRAVNAEKGSLLSPLPAETAAGSCKHADAA